MIGNNYISSGVYLLDEHLKNGMMGGTSSHHIFNFKRDLRKIRIKRILVKI